MRKVVVHILSLEGFCSRRLLSSMAKRGLALVTPHRILVSFSGRCMILDVLPCTSIVSCGAATGKDGGDGQIVSVRMG